MQWFDTFNFVLSLSPNAMARTDSASSFHCMCSAELHPNKEAAPIMLSRLFISTNIDCYMVIKSSSSPVLAPYSGTRAANSVPPFMLVKTNGVLP